MILHQPKAEHLAVLVCAKARLSRTGLAALGKRIYICHAITLASIELNMTRAAVELKSLIAGRLGSVITLDSWIALHHPALVNDLTYTDTEYNRKMQATRHAWINSLIEEFS